MNDESEIWEDWEAGLDRRSNLAKQDMWEGNKVGRGNEGWVIRERVKNEYFLSMSSHCASGTVGCLRLSRPTGTYRMSRCVDHTS